MQSNRSALIVIRNSIPTIPDTPYYVKYITAEKGMDFLLRFLEISFKAGLFYVILRSLAA